MSSRIFDAVGLIRNTRDQIATCFDDFVGPMSEHPSDEYFWKPITDHMNEVRLSVEDDIDRDIKEYASSQDK